MKQTNWREVAKERWIKIADQHQEIERLRAALEEIVNRERLDHSNAASVKIARDALTAAK
jgi:hypothetical protein